MSRLELSDASDCGGMRSACCTRVSGVALDLLQEVSYPEEELSGDRLQEELRLLGEPSLDELEGSKDRSLGRTVKAIACDRGTCSREGPSALISLQAALQTVQTAPTASLSRPSRYEKVLCIT